MKTNKAGNVDIKFRRWVSNFNTVVRRGRAEKLIFETISKGSEGVRDWVSGEGCSRRREHQVQKAGGRIPAKALSSPSRVLIQSSQQPDGIGHILHPFHRQGL